MKNLKWLKKCTHYVRKGFEKGSRFARHDSLSILSRQSVFAILCLLFLGVGEVLAAATNFTTGECLFVQADGNGAWDSSAKVKLWFHSGDDGGTALEPTWICDWSGSGGSGKMFYVIVPSGDNSKVRVQRWSSTWEWWNQTSDINHSDRPSNTNVITAGSNSIAWRSGITYSLELWGSATSWGSSIGTMTHSGAGVFTMTISDFVPSATSYDYKARDSYGHYLGSNNTTVSDFIVGATYDIDVSFTLSSKTLSIIKTQKTFEVTASSADEDMGSVSPSSAWVGSSAVTFTATPKTGYKWSSWDATGGASASDAATSSVTATADGTLTANFSPITYTITLDKGDGGTNGGSAEVDYMATSLSSITHATKTGWSRDGYWTNDVTPVKIIEANGNLIANKSGYTDEDGHWIRTTTPTTLYAHWKQTYSVTYYGNGNTSGEVPTDETEYTSGATVTVAGANTLVKTNYTFSGWKLDYDGEEADYQEDETFSITDNTYLYAHWTKTPYTVTISGGTESSVTITYDEEGSATVSTPINKHFTGWSLGTGVTKAARSNLTDETIYFTATQSSTVTAVFEDINVYMEGRFSCRTTSGGDIDKHVGNSEGAWDLDDKTVQFTWNGSTNKYELQTYCTAAELSANRNGQRPYIRINKCNGSAALSDANVMGPVEGGLILRTGTVVTTGNDNSLYFYSTSATGATNVVITYDPATNKVAYSATETRYDVTISANKDAYGTVSPSGTQSIGCVDVPISATPSQSYYKFKNWTTTGGASVANANSASTTVTATGTGTVTANFTTDGIIFLDKSAIKGDWRGTPYVYFYSSDYWSNTLGTGSKSTDEIKVYGPYAMTQIGSSDIWYYDYSSTPGSGTTKQYVAFNDHSQSNYDNFSKCQAIYRGDFYPGMPMLVVRDWKSYYNNCAYFQQGYWRKYNDTDPGYVVKVYNGFAYGSTCIGTYALSSTEAGDNNCTADVSLTAGTNYFKIKGCDSTTINGVSYTGTYYRDGSNGTMNTDNSTNWLLTDEGGSNTGVLATGTGDYKFTLTLGAGQLFVSVDFPLAVGDYRLVYNGKMRTTYNSKKDHPSHYIRKLKVPTIATDTTRKDTISFFVDPADAPNNPVIRLQYCSSIVGYTVNWSDVSPSVTLDLSSITKAGVYDFIITQTNNQSSEHTISCAYKGAYTGDYYIRTDVAGGGWKTYRETKDNKMIYSEYSKAHSGYDYYHCHWTPTGKNVKFTIANDYSECISDTVENDDYVTRTGANVGKLEGEASVRFMWNSATNAPTRAYLNGSNSGGENPYLYLQVAGDDAPTIYDEEGSTFEYNKATFSDEGNWVYQLDIKADQEARVKLISNYNYGSTDHLQYFKGHAGESGEEWDNKNTEEILGGTYKAGDAPYSLRIIYDYKTNHLVSAWLANGSDVNTPLAIHTDVMIVREGQGDAKQITFSGTGSLTDVDTVYAVMQFNKWIVNNKKLTNHETDSTLTQYERALYWISFPFNVSLNDVFGMGTYGTHWIIEYYDGKERAQKGFWADSPGFWKYVTPAMRDTFTLKANEGYVLALDLEELGESSSVWNYVENVYLYFPSANKVGNIQSVNDTTININQTGYQCTIGPRFDGGDDRRVKDSYWHLIGVPSYANTTQTTSSSAPSDLAEGVVSWEPGSTLYFYEWNPSTNNYTIQLSRDYPFKAMYSYMVQYGNPSMAWTNITNTKTPSSVAARVAETTDYNLKLSLLREDEEQDRTLLRMTNDVNATNRFEFNYDICKEYNGGRANIWTVTADTIEVAGNCLPTSTQTTIIPVGVKVVANGEYTFAIPDGTGGVNVTLVDSYANTRTNLGLIDYTTYLTTGTYEGRFMLEISPVQNMPTDMEIIDNGQLTNDNDGVRKVLIDGRLYIVKDGKAYDAQGQMVN